MSASFRTSGGPSVGWVKTPCMSKRMTRPVSLGGETTTRQKERAGYSRAEHPAESLCGRRLRECSGRESPVGRGRSDRWSAGGFTEEGAGRSKTYCRCPEVEDDLERLLDLREKRALHSGRDDAIS